jgi:hypothetical protein
MQINRFKAAFGLAILGAALFIQACDPKEPVVVEPDLTALNNVKLPDVTPTQPAAVTAVPGSVTPAPAAGVPLANILAKSVTPAVTKAKEDTKAALGTSDAKAVVDAFTPAVITGLQTTGTLPAALQTQVNALLASPALAIYLPKLTAPTVNGTAVGGRSRAPQTAEILNAPFMSAVANDACFAAAETGLNNVKATLLAGKTAQEATINAAYTQRETTINAGVVTCKAGIATGIATQITAAKAGLDGALVAINDLTATSAVTADEADLLRVFVLLNYTASVQRLKTLESLENQRCDRTQVAELAAAKAVQTNDLATVNTNYNAALKAATDAYKTAVQVCHNQGSGS